MSDNPSSARANAQARAHVNFVTWTVVIFMGHAIGMALFLGLAGFALNIPVGKLLVPYATLLYCGLVFSPLLYWARLSRERPKSCATRFAIAIFLYLQVLTLALGFATVTLGILSKETAISYAPFMLPFSSLVSIAAYFPVRQMLVHRGP